AGAPNSVHAYVSRLRRVLRPDRVVRSGPGYQLVVEPGELDADRFARLVADGRELLAAGQPERAAATLREALALWRGPALADVAYEPFTSHETARLDELRLDAVEERIEADLELGRHRELVAELEALASEHPLRERPARPADAGPVSLGPPCGGLALVSRCARRVVQELGLEPNPELQELERATLGQDRALVALRQRGASPRGARRRGPAVGIAVGALVVIAAIALAAILSTRRNGAPPLAPNAIAKIDPETHKVVDVFPVGGAPGKPAVVGNYVFVGSDEDKTLSRIDIRSGEIDTVGTFRSPAGVAPGRSGTLWVGSSDTSQVLQIHANDCELVRLLDVPHAVTAQSVVAGEGSVWV